MFQWFQKIKNYHMASNSVMFDTYIKYFASINKKIKLQRKGINVLSSNGELLETYKTWDDLNAVYRQVQTDELADIPIPSIQGPKLYCWGNTNPKIADKLREAILGDQKSTSFNNPKQIYYMDSHGYLCQTSNELVIDLITNSKEWEEYKYKPVKLTKEEIAKKFGFTSVDEFEII